ncbi:MAG: hypothetical protein ACQEXQ_20070 [Bacillota bacterium]
MKRARIILAVSLVVLAISVYGSISLYTKLNKVDELNQRMEKTAKNEDSQVSDPVLDQPPAQDEKPEAESDEYDVQAAEPSEEPGGESSTTPSATPTPEQTSGDAGEGQKPEGDATVSVDKAQKKQKIDAAITAEMEQLRASCQTVSKSLVEQILGELSGNKEATLKTIQDKYLTKVFAAEASCDARFNQLLSSVQRKYAEAYLYDQALPDWSSQYESAKEQARADALVAIANTVQK